MTWIAAAGQHNSLQWYKEMLEDRGLEIEFINKEQNRMTVAKPVSS